MLLNQQRLLRIGLRIGTVCGEAVRARWIGRTAVLARRIGSTAVLGAFGAPAILFNRVENRA